MLDAHHIVTLQAETTTRWHDASIPEPTPTDSWDALILNQHRANFDLWHHEDAARDPDATDHDITQHKHAIDTLNQRRNDLVEQIDILLLSQLPTQNATARLHSETPGLMIDRLSILALKRFHTEEETRRPDASSEHHQRNRDRLNLLDIQRADLARCLDELWWDVANGVRRIKLYRQMKMYNDPSLNPVLYRKSSTSGPSLDES